MKKTIFKPILGLALLSLGIAACDPEDELTQKQVEVTITVSLPAEYNGVSLANVPKDSIDVAIGEDHYLTNTAGEVVTTLPEGLYSIIATATKLVVGSNTEGSNGVYVLSLMGTANADISEANPAASITLTVIKDVFTSYGSLAALKDTLHLRYKGDTLNLNGLFTPVLEAGDNRATSITYEIATPARKKETGGSATGAWVELPYLYSVKNSLLIAADTLSPAPFDLTNITGRKREVEPAVLRASLYAEGNLLAVKEVPVVIDTIDIQLIGILPIDDNPVTSEIFYRLIPGSEPPTMTLAAPYGGTSGLTINATSFKGYFSNLSGVSYGNVNRGDSIRNTLQYTYAIVGLNVIYTYFIDAVAVNDNGIAIPRPGESTTGDANNGHPISAQGSSTANIANFYLNRTREGQTPVEGETGYIDFFPYGSDPSNFITYRLKVETVSVTGIAPLTNDLSQLATVARRFRANLPFTDKDTVVNASFFANLKVSKGPDRVYVVNENNADPLLVIPSTINKIDGSPTIKLVTGTTAQKNAALSLDGGDTYIAAQFVQLVNRNLPAGTSISFKVCPKSKFDSGGTPDPNWTVEITTKIYEN